MAVSRSFLAHFLIFFKLKKLGCCNGGPSALTFPCGHDNLKSFSCIFLKFILHLASNQVLDKVNNGRKIYSKWPIYYDFSHFTLIILLCGRNNFKNISSILLKFVLHAANKQFSDNFNNGGGLFFQKIITFKRWLEAEA